MKLSQIKCTNFFVIRLLSIIGLIYFSFVCCLAVTLIQVAIISFLLLIIGSICVLTFGQKKENRTQLYFMGDLNLLFFINWIRLQYNSRYKVQIIKYMLLVILPFFISCKKEFKQPTILDKNCGFDLEHINFNENITKLYSKNFINDYEFEMDKEYNPNEKLADTIFRYKISNIVTETMNFKVPSKEFGYLYKTPELDSVAKFKNIYFNTIHTLCNTSKKPVAYYAEARFENLKFRNQYLTEFIKTFGPPKYSFRISNEFNQCSYEWDLGYRTIQIETSFGWGASFSSDENNENGKYYRLDMLIISNNYADAIKKVHELILPDKIMYRGKLYSYKDFQLEKVSNVKDEFLLNSTNKDFIKDEYGEYDIKNAENDE